MNVSFQRISIYIAALAMFTGCATPKQSNDEIPSFNWITSDQPIDLSWAKEVGAKTFPEGKTFSANTFGAVNDSTVLSTEAIQAAIDSCHNSGGGTVTLEPGYYATGALFIKQGVNFEVGKGVTLYASTDINDYPESRTRVAGIEMVWPSAVLNIKDTDNAAISGEGVIDCRGKVFWDKYWEMRTAYVKEDLRWIVDYDCKRVRGILVSNSTNVTLKDFTLMRTGFWGTQVLYSKNCTVNGITIDNNKGGHGPSTDGIDIDSSSFILIENCDVDCNDDNICIKAGRDADGLRVNRPTEYVVVRNCTTQRGAGLITCGSETSGGIRHVLGYNLRAKGTSAALRIKSAMNRGGFVENIYMADVVADSVRSILAADLNWNPSYSYSELPATFEGKEIPEHWKVMLTKVEPKEKGYPRFKNIYLANVKANGCNQFITAAGWSDSLRLENFQLNNIEAEVQKAGRIKLTNGFILKGIKLKTADGNPLELEDNIDLTTDVQYE